jgi:perosamine synthetase
LTQVTALKTHKDRTHAFHLYVVKLAKGIDRDRVFAQLRAEGIGANVHYAPVHLHSFYRQRGFGEGLAPVAETVSGQLLTLPLFPTLAEADVHRVVTALAKAAS